MLETYKGPFNNYIKVPREGVGGGKISTYFYFEGEGEKHILT